MKFIDKYILYTSTFSLFSEDFSFHYIIDFKLFYIIILINSILLLIKAKKLNINKNLIVIISFLLIHGIVFFLLYKNPIGSLFAQLIGISISSIFFYSYIKKFGISLVFKTYLNMAFWIAVLAIPMYAFKINTLDVSRLNGILSEPAHYTAIILPSVYVFLRDKKYLKFTIVFITVLLSKSTIGYLGLFLILIMPLLKIKYFLKYSFGALIILLLSSIYIGYNYNKIINKKGENDVMLRINQTLGSYNSVFNGRFKNNTNVSSYAFLSNTFISTHSFLNHPFGSGIGSYKYQYERYYPLMHPPDYLKTLKLSKINNQDANSLFLRMLVDLGIFSFLFFGYFIFNTFKVFKNDKNIMQKGTFFYLIVKIIREGHYFPPEFYFFLIIFLKDSNEDTSYSRGLLFK